MLYVDVLESMLSLLVSHDCRDSTKGRFCLHSVRSKNSLGHISKSVIMCPAWSNDALILREQALQARTAVAGRQMTCLERI